MLHSKNTQETQLELSRSRIPLNNLPELAGSFSRALLHIEFILYESTSLLAACFPSFSSNTSVFTETEIDEIPSKCVSYLMQFTCSQFLDSDSGARVGCSSNQFRKRDSSFGVAAEFRTISVSVIALSRLRSATNSNYKYLKRGAKDAIKY